MCLGAPLFEKANWTPEKLGEIKPGVDSNITKLISTNSYIRVFVKCEETNIKKSATLHYDGFKWHF